MAGTERFFHSKISVPQVKRSVAPAGLASFTRVDKQKDVGPGTQTFQTKKSPKGRYVLIWFTKLPPKPSSSNTFEAFIYNIVIRGTG